MNPRKSKLLVVDASIVSRNEYPVSKQCRELLYAILEICHRVILTPEIKEEWDLHQMQFVRQWRRRMMAKKKLVIQSSSSLAALKDKITKVEKDPTKLEAMMKDSHLIEASLRANKIILSLDDSARDAFSSISIKIKEIKSILWLNPKHECDDTINQWLEDGAVIIDRWTLAHNIKE